MTKVAGMAASYASEAGSSVWGRVISTSLVAVLTSALASPANSACSHMTVTSSGNNDEFALTCYGFIGSSPYSPYDGYIAVNSWSSVSQTGFPEDRGTPVVHNGDLPTNADGEVGVLTEQSFVSIEADNNISVERISYTAKIYASAAQFGYRNSLSAVSIVQQADRFSRNGPETGGPISVTTNGTLKTNGNTIYVSSSFSSSASNDAVTIQTRGTLESTDYAAIVVRNEARSFFVDAGDVKITTDETITGRTHGILIINEVNQASIDVTTNGDVKSNTSNGIEIRNASGENTSINITVNGTVTLGLHAIDVYNYDSSRDDHGNTYIDTTGGTLQAADTGIVVDQGAGGNVEITTSDIGNDGSNNGLDTQSGIVVRVRESTGQTSPNKTTSHLIQLLVV